MSVKIRPIEKGDKLRMVPRSGVCKINSSPMIGLDKVSKLPNNVVSDTIFGKTTHNVADASLKEFEDKYTRVGYIDLVKPVLNQFLAGRNAPVWRRILRISQDMISDIINVHVIWDNESESFVSLSSIGQKPYDPERYVFGAELLLKMLHEADIDDALNKAIIGTYIVPCMTRTEKAAYKDDMFNVGTIYELGQDELVSALQGDTPGWLYGNYAIDLSDSDFSDVPDEKLGGMTRREKLLDDISDMVMDMCTNDLSQYSLVDVLTIIKRDGVSVLESQILDYVFVLPYGYRPTIDGRVDALTSQYNKLVNANQELQDILDRKDPTIYTVMNKYREVVQYIRNIFIGDDYVISSQRLKDYKSISDSLSGKKGLMRDRMQGARIDYSGRAVITSDPNMPIDMIGVPIKMLMKTMEPSVIRELRKYKISEGDKGTFGWRNLSTFSQTSSKEKDGITYEEFVRKYIENDGRYDRYGMLGRQPTLFYLGIQGFRVVPVEGDALVLSPLVVMPFNADFDGDQMHFAPVFSKRAQSELRNNMYFKANMRYPKNGEITVVTRHEIIYGLWICKQKGNEPGGKSVSEVQLKDMTADIDECRSNGGFMRAVYECVCKQRLSVYDKVTTPTGVKPAGVVALEYAVYGGTSGICDFNDPSFRVKAKDLTKRAAEYYGANKDGFLHAINRMVRLGFSVAKVWPPNISVIVDSSITSHINDLVTRFNENILEREEYVDLGIETEEEFSSYFSREWKKLEKQVTDYLVDNLDPENGYLTMWKSGAKGDQNNLRQIFGLKGRVQKNDISTFNSIISGSYAGQLTGMDHFITAYGSRQGIADKVLATAEPGYLSRRLEHAGSIISVTATDCGTDQGMEFTLEDIVPFLDESQISKYGIYPAKGMSKVEEEQFWSMPETVTQMDAATNYLAKILVGRYIITDESNAVFIENDSVARYYIKDAWDRKPFGAVKMRAVAYCNCPCCQVCYGRDIAAGTDAPAIGRPIGFIAAQAIGEPGTQLTMKNFQKGGVVSEANLTSSFELIDDYFELHDFSKKRRNKRGIISYDRISPVSGYVKEQYLGNGGKRVIVTATPSEDDRVNLIPGTTKIVVQENTVLKDYVRVGDSFQRIQGDLNMREVLRYRGFDKAVSYLTLTLYSIFGTQDVAFKHFETIVAAMSVMVLATDANSDVESPVLNYGKGSTYRAGSVLTLPEVRYGVVQAAGVWTLLGLKNLPKYKPDFFESLLMEDMDSYVPRAIIMNPNDSMSNPITRVAFGLNIGIGSDIR